MIDRKGVGLHTLYHSTTPLATTNNHMCDCIEVSDWVAVCEASGAGMKRQLNRQVFKSDLVGRETARGARVTVIGIAPLIPVLNPGHLSYIFVVYVPFVFISKTFDFTATV